MSSIVAVRTVTLGASGVRLLGVTDPSQRKRSGVPEWLIVVPLLAFGLAIAVIFAFL